MEPYRDWDRDSGVEAYEIGSDYITVKFKSGKCRYYKYTYSSAGSSHVEEMKRLAVVGNGLNEYIGDKKIGYSSKW